MSLEKKPRYQQIKDYLQQQIAANTYTPDEKLPSEKELCEQFKVSRITVRKALSELEESGTIYRVAGRGTYISPSGARRMKTDASVVSNSPKRRIGIVMATLENPFQVALFESMERKARAESLSIMFGLSNCSTETESKLLDDMVADGVDGIILYSADGALYNNRVLKLRMDNFPIVLVDRYLPGIDACSVCFDNRDGGMQIGHYLVESGHKNIGLITSPPEMTVSMKERIEGFQEVLFTAGLAQPAEYRLCDLYTYSSPASMAMRKQYDINYQKICAFIERNPEITAVFAAKSNIAVNVYRAIKNLGRSIEIACFDTINEYEWTDDIDIVQVQHSEEMMGMCAVEQLVHLMNGEKAESIVVPCRLVKRAGAL